MISSDEFASRQDLWDAYGILTKKYVTLYEAIEEIAFYGTSRPAEMGEDDGDCHYKKIAHRLINIAAIARRQIR